MSLLLNFIFYINHIIFYTWQLLLNIYNWRLAPVILSAARGLEAICRLNSPSLYYVNADVVEITYSSGIDPSMEIDLEF
ncbi:MAG: hypothetical protein EAZ73_26845 [Oscillatoriales cyanobacterium]|nr:MAG: hypothetical protein EAZ83_25785 [Oscillatoriales cyanobacterium]TAF15458.1 MAG: hypothetical protein EAZ73_26845 [Oscillatoriales cyanobacterium]TAF28701.1 MAG: hypothetical protein EAZ69_26115 [Oscillatoriales cyanobacterium]